MIKTVVICEDDISGACNLTWKKLCEGLNINPELAENIRITISDNDINELIFDNIFSLCADDESEDDIDVLKDVTESLIQILDHGANRINGASVQEFSDYNKILIPIAYAVRAFRFGYVGVGDTATDECITYYFGKQLECNNIPLHMINTPDDVDKVQSMFYQLIHFNRKHSGIFTSSPLEQ